MTTRKRHTDAEIRSKLTQAAELASSGKTQDEIARALGVSVMTFHRWRKLQRQSSRMRTPAAAHEPTSLLPDNAALERNRPGRLAELQLENARLRRLVTDLLLEKIRLEEEDTVPL